MPGPQVVTSEGTVEGTSHDGFERYLGIPYAAPPVGDRRFRSPDAPPRFDGVFSATTFAPHAPQAPSVLEQALGEGAPLVISERDCLALNVWTPRADDARRPVMFWIHGGSFLWGSSSSPLYDGASFAANHDVVVVSCNYRLGLLGFTYVAPLGGDDFAGSGSLGVQDAAAALRWVRDNVASFGGDPDNVTVFGESAGAMVIGTLLALPSARGLFHRAILQSGAASTYSTATRAAAHFEELRELLGSPTSIEELQSMSVERLLEAQQEITDRHRSSGLVFSPVVDGSVLDVAPIDAVASGRARDVSLLVGTNLDEWRLFSATDPDLLMLDDQRLEASVAPWFTGDPGAAVTTYRKRLGEAPAKLVHDCFWTDVTFRVPAIRLAERQHAAGGRAHMYLFSWPSPALGGMLGAFHGLELPFVFNTLGAPSGMLLAGDAAPSTLATAMHAAWSAFAHHGDPGGGPLGAWPTYDPTSRATLLLDTHPRIEEDPLADERALWDG